jgi:Ca-activated chloride channel family protein
MHHWFANPRALTLLAVLPALALLALLARRRRARALTRLGSVLAFGSSVAVRDHLAPLRGLCFTTGLSLLVVGIAGPQWGRDWARAAPGRDVVVVLDMSRSMTAESPSRFQRAKNALADLADMLQKRGGHRVGLVVFAGRAKVVCPLTHDYDHFRETLEELDAADPPDDLRPVNSSDSGTRIGAGLRAAAALHDDRFHGFQDIMLISDGDDPVPDNEWHDGVTAAHARGIPVHTVGVGDPDNDSPIPTADGPLMYNDKVIRTRLVEKPLEDIARLTGGTYTPAHTKGLPLGELFRERIEARPGHENDDGVDSLQVYQQRYAWFFGGALLLLAFASVSRPLAHPLAFRARATAGVSHPRLPRVERARNLSLTESTQ